MTQYLLNDKHFLANHDYKSFPVSRWQKTTHRHTGQLIPYSRVKRISYISAYSHISAGRLLF